MPAESSAPAAGPRSRNRRGEGGRLRADILAAACELLAETGDEQAVTLRAVARKIGISAPSIYGHFADRHAILLAVATDAFAELATRLNEDSDAAGPDPAARLRACCQSYLDFAATRPHLYRVMFGGLWSVAEGLEQQSFTSAEAAELGRDVVRVVSDSLLACVQAGVSTSTDPGTDVIALWLGLHGLAHQRAVAPAFPWPGDIDERLITLLAQLR